MSTGTALMNRILLALSRAGLTVFRNNTARAWAGRSMPLKAGEVYRARGGERVVFDARPLRAGLCEGSGDIIGIETVEVTPDMVGSRIGLFVSAEVKAGSGRPTQAQKNFAAHVQACGGKAVIVHSEAEALAAFDRKG